MKDLPDLLDIKEGVGSELMAIEAFGALLEAAGGGDHAEHLNESPNLNRNDCYNIGYTIKKLVHQTRNRLNAIQ